MVDRISRTSKIFTGLEVNVPRLPKPWPLSRAELSINAYDDLSHRKFAHFLSPFSSIVLIDRNIPAYQDAFFYETQQIENDYKSEPSGQKSQSYDRYELLSPTGIKWTQ
jgi:hypothetical protein